MKNSKALLKLALLQLQEYSSNEFVIVGDERFNIADTLEEINDSEYAQEKEAKEVLTDLGICASNMWSIEDVTGHYDCSEEEAMDVLDDASQSESLMESMWFNIHYSAAELGLKRKS
jgi:hypothetical protein